MPETARRKKAANAVGIPVPALNVDWQNPLYAPIFAQRRDMLARLDAMDAAAFNGLRAHYRANPVDFIQDWGVTFDPRQADVDLPTVIPFVLFPRQRDWIAWVLERWGTRTRGINEKSRDMGVTWLAVALSCTLCLFREGVVIGFGSRKAEYVDQIGTMKPILPKARMFMEYLPRRFRGDWEAWRDAPKMRVNFPATGSLITGEAGDAIGRGDRTSLYFVDESAHLPRPLLVESSLSNTTRCRIDMSSVNGMNNPFAQKRWSGTVPVFTFKWTEDPRKNQAWYDAQVRDYDPVTVAQEVDMDYSASVEGIVIPGEWARAAIGARKKLGIAPSGLRALALDVADEGLDKNCLAAICGIEVEWTEERTGKDSDIYRTVEWVFQVCDEDGYEEFRYDADGLGAGVRGDARAINIQRRKDKLRLIRAVGFRGSEGVYKPEKIVEGTKGREGGDSDKGRKNKDMFANRKAQGWWSLRRRFQLTYRWVVQGKPCNPDDIISISPDDPDHMQLVAELSQPTYETNPVGKILIDKKPGSTKSPNRADAVMIRYAEMESPPVAITPRMLQQIAQAGPYGKIPTPKTGGGPARVPGARLQALQQAFGRHRR